jgi:hypothetical protein
VGRRKTVTKSIQLETARAVDRDAVLLILEERGITAKAANGELAIEVDCGDCGQVLLELEALVRESELPLVPIEAGGRIFLRPPGD